MDILPTGITEEEFKNTKLIFNDEGIYFPPDTKLGEDIVIMEKWEKPHIEKSILLALTKILPLKVLEVGFGYGYTASVINSFPSVVKHVICEPHPEMFAKAKEWSKGKNVILINDFVQNYKTNEHFNLVYDDRKELVYINDRYEFNFTYDWLAKIFQDEYINGEKYNIEDDGFWFESGGVKYYQPIERWQS